MAQRKSLVTLKLGWFGWVVNEKLTRIFSAETVDWGGFVVWMGGLVVWMGGLVVWMGGLDWWLFITF